MCSLRNIKGSKSQNLQRASTANPMQPKIVAQSWSRNVTYLTQDVKSQINMLSNVNNQGKDEGGAQEGSMPINYFDLIYERMFKEIDMLMMSAKAVMSLSASKNTGGRKLSEKDVDQAWKNES
jgi:hypothetical protein